MLTIEPIYQKHDSDCGVACVQMVLNYYQTNNRGIHSLTSSIDGVQARTIESYLREKGFMIVSGNMDLKLLRYYIKAKTPIICLIEGHYIVVTGFDKRKIVYNCPANGQVIESLAKFKKKWFNISDGACLVNWGIAVGI
jgi:ABC-type bacteriocin/lantibiotic exporter with double-glycine peptidase domain